MSRAIDHAETLLDVLTVAIMALQAVLPILVGLAWVRDLL